MKSWRDRCAGLGHWLFLLPLLPLMVLLWSCQGPLQPPTVSVNRSGLEVACSMGIQQVRLLSHGGALLIAQRAPAPVSDMEVRLTWPSPGSYIVETLCDNELFQDSIVVPEGLPPFQVLVEAPVGQGSHLVPEGEDVPVSLFDEAQVQGAVIVVPYVSGTYELWVDGSEHKRQYLARGEQLVTMMWLNGPRSIVVRGPDHEQSFDLRPKRQSLSSAQEVLKVERLTFPADPGGGADLARPQGRVSLPSPWWKALLSHFALGVRARDLWAPWSFSGITLYNQGDTALNVAVQLRIVDEGGEVSPAFLPLMRDGIDANGAVQRLLRIPPHSQATAALPVYVRDALLPESLETVYQQVTVWPLGSERAILSEEHPLYISRGSGLASAGLLGAILAAIFGSFLLLRRARSWLEQAATSELMTIALFGALTFVVAAAGRLIGMGVAAALGPFSTLLTGLVDDVFRYALLGTLITLLPRVGTASLATLVSWLLSGLALGTFGPTDILFVGGRVFWLEGFLWLFGLTRGTAWLGEGALRRWLRMSLAFGLASVFTAGTGLVLHVVLYRLFLAPWYVVMILVGPSFLYVFAACAIAIPFADSLRQVQR